MRIQFLLAVAVALCPLFSVAAQEVSSGRATLKEDTSSIAEAMEAKNTALLTILGKLTTCNATGKFYRPGVAGADANGCVAPAAPTSGFSVTYSSQYSAAQKKTVSMGAWSYCAQTGFTTAEENHSCRVTRSGGNWTLQGSQFSDGATCYATCFKIQ